MSRLLKERQAILASPVKTEPEQARQLSPTEREWKQRIFDRLLKVLDLSLLGSLREEDARNQVREITNRLLLEESAPLLRKITQTFDDYTYYRATSSRKKTPGG